MASIETSIDCDCPVRVAYNQWTQFEEFPRFMEGVESVEQITDDRLHWTAEIAGAKREWDAKITQQEPDRVIAWRSETGQLNAGIVTFQPIEDDRCRITLQMEYEPNDWKEKAADVLGFITRRVEGDLERFKEFIEARGRETGGWRGRIDDEAGAGVTAGMTGVERDKL